MRHRRINGATVLHALREKPTTWARLAQHFGVDPFKLRTVDAFFWVCALERAGLVECTPSTQVQGAERYEQRKNRRTWLNRKITVTSMLSEVQNVLDISISELAGTNPNNRFTATPIFDDSETQDFDNDVFVAMPFIPELGAVYTKAIRNAAAALELTVARGDDFFTNGAIVNQIWGAIRACRVVVADCTGRNPNVFYELGLAHSLGKPTIILSRDEDEVPFDVLHLRRINYELSNKGLTTLERALKSALKRALEGDDQSAHAATMARKRKRPAG